MKGLVSLSLIFSLFLVSAGGLFMSPEAVVAQTQDKLTNKDVIQMVKAGISSEVIIAKIKSSKTEFNTSTEALQELKKEGVPDAIVLVMLRSGKEESENKPAENTTESKPTRVKDELTSIFYRLQNSVVTVWSESSSGSGFIFDKDGLIMTNYHVVGKSRYIAVQFDSKRKIPAVLLAASPERDIAILWANLEAIPDAVVAPIAKVDSAEPAVVEGERVLAIGSPLNQRKIMTVGVVSKIEEKVILSDVNVNPGNSGGPLFNSIGEVVGIVTFRDAADTGPGIAGILRIEQALPLIAEAKQKMSQTQKPEARFLPVDPTDTFPLDAIKEVVTAPNFDTDVYMTGVGGFYVGFFTPALMYRLETEAQRKAAKAREKRNKKSEGSNQQTSDDPMDVLENFYSWREYLGDYKPVLVVRVLPPITVSAGSMVARGLGLLVGISSKAKLKFNEDFDRMRLLCGNKEVEPIHPGRVFRSVSIDTGAAKLDDAAYEGIYWYPADAISPECGTVTIEIYSEQKPNQPERKVLKDKLVRQIINDFAPYLEKRKQQQ